MEFHLCNLPVRHLIVERCAGIDGMDNPAFAFLFVVKYAVNGLFSVNMVIVETSEQTRSILKTFYDIVEMVHHHIIFLCTVNRHTSLLHVGRELGNEFVQCLDVL